MFLNQSTVQSARGHATYEGRKKVIKFIILSQSITTSDEE